MEQYNNELEIMREQLSALKKKIDTQEIINDKLLRKTLKEKNAFSKSYGKTALFLFVPLALLIWGACRYVFGFSWPLILVVILGCIVDAILDFHITNRLIPQALKGSSVDAIKEMKNINSMIKKQFIIGSVLFILVIIWAFVEVWHTNNGVIFNMGTSPEEMRYSICFSLVFGLIVGFVCAFVIFRKIIRNNNDIVQLLNEFQRDNEE